MSDQIHAIDYAHDAHTIAVDEHGTAFYHYGEGGESIAQYGGASAIHDELGNGVIINLVPDGQTTAVDGPTIRSENDVAYQELRAAVSEETWAAIGIDALLAQTPLTLVKDEPAAAEAEDVAHEATDRSAIEPVAAQVAPATEPVIPDNHLAVDVPEEIAAQLPEGTKVSTNEDGLLVAHVPIGGSIHRIVAGVEHTVAHLVGIVKAYLERL